MTEDQVAKMLKGLEALFKSIDAKLSDIVECMEGAAKKPPDNTDIIDAIRTVSRVKPPEVSLTLPELQPKLMLMPAEWDSLSVEVSKPSADGSKSMKITRK